MANLAAIIVGPALSHERLSRQAIAALLDFLKANANAPDKAQEGALFSLLCAMTDMARGKLTGRWAFPLPTGHGKSSSVIMWLSALATLKADHASVAVASSKVEELCKLKRALITQGVPADWIGLKHSKRYDPSKLPIDRSSLDYFTDDTYASEPSEGTDRRIVLVTHSRVRGCNFADFGTYKGKPRNLMIYDESLITSDATGLAVNRIRSTATWIVSEHPKSLPHLEASEHLLKCHALIDAKVDSLREGDADNVFVTLPLLTPEQVEAYKRCLSNNPLFDPARRLLDLSGERLRVIPTDNGGVGWFQVSVPEDIRNVIILDASHPIRSLIHADSTIRNAEDHPSVRRNCPVPMSQSKRYDNVAIRHLKWGGGRSTLEAGFAAKRREDRKVSREIVEVVKSISATEAVLIFTYKGNGKGSIKDVILSDLRDAGVDIDAKVDGLPRISVATFGMETGSNLWSHCHHVMLAGVLLRSHEDLAAAYLGQRNDIEAPIDRKLITDLQQAEAAHVAYQAGSRGRMRRSVGGQAEAMTLWAIHSDASLVDRLVSIMPGAKVNPWRAQHGTARGGTTTALAQKIGDHMAGVPEGMDSMSTRRLKAAVAQGVADGTWKRALAEYLTTNPGWLLRGRSLVRGSAVFAPA